MKYKYSITPKEAEALHKTVRCLAKQTTSVLLALVTLQEESRNSRLKAAQSHEIGIIKLKARLCKTGDDTVLLGKLCSVLDEQSGEQSAQIDLLRSEVEQLSLRLQQRGHLDPENGGALFVVAADELDEEEYEEDSDAT
jgi:hypothetical protein